MELNSMPCPYMAKRNGELWAVIVSDAGAGFAELCADCRPRERGFPSAPLL